MADDTTNTPAAGETSPTGRKKRSDAGKPKAGRRVTKEWVKMAEKRAVRRALPTAAAKATRKPRKGKGQIRSWTWMEALLPPLVAEARYLGARLIYGEISFDDPMRFLTLEEREWLRPAPKPRKRKAKQEEWKC
ncbi:MAG: hypothetical protein KGL39_06750 [Patescibacteria group bacterium]|nr:hypothetical protein [Patescibacteria group bacterium]